MKRAGPDSMETAGGLQAKRQHALGLLKDRPIMLGVDHRQFSTEELGLLLSILAGGKHDGGSAAMSAGTSSAAGSSPLRPQHAGTCSHCGHVAAAGAQQCVPDVHGREPYPQRPSASGGVEAAWSFGAGGLHVPSSAYGSGGFAHPSGMAPGATGFWTSALGTRLGDAGVERAAALLPREENRSQCELSGDQPWSDQTGTVPRPGSAAGPGIGAAQHALGGAPLASRLQGDSSRSSMSLQGGVSAGVPGPGGGSEVSGGLQDGGHGASNTGDGAVRPNRQSIGGDAGTSAVGGGREKASHKRKELLAAVGSRPVMIGLDPGTFSTAELAALQSILLSGKGAAGGRRDTASGAR